MPSPGNFRSNGLSIHLPKGRRTEDSSSNDDSWSPVLDGISQPEEEIESEAGSLALEQTTQPHVEFPPKATSYFAGYSQQSFSFD
ncbi:hypothetical protein LIER_06504 [Lithospermum erythrorhizon]|uniref:Uncharacterized protein n=1 Tax=Lithospermum erythrorhizon TaxID=34254 RepID=A0AAV3P8J4_LITER